MGKLSDRGRTWRVMVKEGATSFRSQSRVHAFAPLSLFGDEWFAPVACNSYREKCDASDAAVEVFIRWSDRMDRRRSVLPLPAIQKPALLCHCRSFICGRHTINAGTHEMEPSLSRSQRGDLQRHPPPNPFHPASPCPEILLHPTNLVHLHQGR